MMGSFGGVGGRLATFFTFHCFKRNDKERMRMSTRKMVGIESNVRNNRFMFFVWCRKNRCVKKKKKIHKKVSLLARSLGS